MKPLSCKSSFYFLVPLLTCVNFGCLGEATDTDFVRKRQAMVEDQIEARGVKDEKVLHAMKAVARHRFVPDCQVRFAYADTPLPIGEGQTISQPYIVALMTELLNLKPSDKVLEIGTGSGYQAAVLAHLCKDVYSIEIVETLGEKAKKLFAELGYENIHTKIGDGYKGWLEHQPYNAIIVTCAPTEIPEPLIEQLAEGGRMIIPVGAYSQELILLAKENGKLKKHSVIPVRFVPMVDRDQKVY